MIREPYNFYEKYAVEYDEWKYTPGVKKFQELEKGFLIKNITPNSKVIDIGCGNGEHIASILDKKCDIVGVDFIKTMIDIARKKVGEKVKFINDDIRNLSFDKNQFDFGICYCTLPNQKDYRAIFHKISYFCTTLIISIYNWDRNYELAEFYRINNLHPKIDKNSRTLFINEGLRYRFLHKKVVQKLYEQNGYFFHIEEHSFGNIYKGIKRG